ncbi:MAG: hypothetical protein ACREN7_09740 [Candidatus Dormibacteria bacterium]
MAVVEFRVGERARLTSGRRSGAGRSLLPPQGGPGLSDYTGILLPEHTESHEIESPGVDGKGLDRLCARIR